MRANVIALGAALCLVGAAGIAVIVALRHHAAVPETKYGIVFDAGSSGTRLYLYRWPSQKIASTGLVSQEYHCRANGSGLSGYEFDPCAAGRSLAVCLDHAKEKVPERQHASTQVYLAATAGMRLLNETNQRSAESILRSVRKELRSSGFGFDDERQQARIMSGQEEGVASWITVNYVKGKLRVSSSGTTVASLDLNSGSSPSDTYGVLDLGGASTQITFADYSHATPWNYTANVTLMARNYRLYSYSFQCYGTNEALNIYHANLIKEAYPAEFDIEDPCAPRGYTEFVSSLQLLTSPCSKVHMPSNGSGMANKMAIYSFNGTGNATACKNRVRSLFDFSSCTFAACFFAGVYMPSNITSVDFTAISGYYYVTFNLNLINVSQPRTTKDEFSRGAHNLCESSWNQVRAIKRRDPQKQCFLAQYAYTLLTEGYRLGENQWHRIRFAKEANGTDFNWALGYMLSLTNVIPSRSVPIYIIAQATYVTVVVIATVVLLAGAVIAIVARKKMTQQKARIQC